MMPAEENALHHGSLAHDRRERMAHSNKNNPRMPLEKAIYGIVVLAIALAGALFGGQAVDTGAPAPQKVASSQEQTEQTSSLTFRNEDRLESHYLKHGIDMGYDSAEDYQAGANAVISNPNVLHKTQAEDGDDVYFLKKTGEFVVVSQQGYIRTYFIADEDYYDRQ